MSTPQMVQTVKLILLLTIMLLMALLSFQSAPGAYGQAEPTPAPLSAGGGYALLSASAAGHFVTDVSVARQTSAPAASAAGGGYVLLLPAEVQSIGTPCCCMHLPCIKK